jgi:hypothetical protein
LAVVETQAGVVLAVLAAMAVALAAAELAVAGKF